MRAGLATFGEGRGARWGVKVRGGEHDGKVNEIE